MKKLLIALILILILMLPISSNCLGPSISKHTAVWDANTESDLAGYYLYWRTQTGSFSDINRIAVVKSANPTLDLNTLNLPADIYIIAVSAIDVEGNESALSNEVIWDARYPNSPKNVQVK